MRRLFSSFTVASALTCSMVSLPGNHSINPTHFKSAILGATVTHHVPSEGGTAPQSSAGDRADRRAGDYLAADGRVDLESLIASGYQGSLNVLLSHLHGLTLVRSSSILIREPPVTFM